MEMQSNIGTTAFAENSFSISHLDETFHIIQGKICTSQKRVVRLFASVLLGKNYLWESIKKNYNP